MGLSLKSHINGEPVKRIYARVYALPKGELAEEWMYRSETGKYYIADELVTEVREIQPDTAIEILKVWFELDSRRLENVRLESTTQKSPV